MNNTKVSHPVLFTIIAGFFVLSLVLIAVGFRNATHETEITSELSQETIAEENEDSLSDFFPDTEEGLVGSDAKNIYLGTDPFAQKCLNDGSGGNSYTASGVKCYY